MSIPEDGPAPLAQAPRQTVGLWGGVVRYFNGEDAEIIDAVFSHLFKALMFAVAVWGCMQLGRIATVLEKFVGN